MPDPDVLPRWAKNHGIYGSYEELCKNPKVKEAVLTDITKHGKDAGLKGFEQVGVIHAHYPNMAKMQVSRGLNW